MWTLVILYIQLGIQQPVASFPTRQQCEYARFEYERVGFPGYCIYN